MHLVTQGNSLQEILWLKAQINRLELENALLIAKIDELSVSIVQFSTALTQHIGIAMLELQLLRLKSLEKKANLSQKQEDIDAFFAEKYARQHFEEQLQIPASPILPPEVQENLKKLYYKIVKLCHPDMVSEAHKTQAEQIFNAAKQAFDQQNAELLHEILHNLEQGVAFAIDIASINELDVLQALYQKLLRSNAMFIQQLQDLQNCSEAKKMEELGGNWQPYFDSLVEKIRQEIAFLKKS